MENNNMFAGEKISENITLCPDGKYRWRYDMSLFKNPTIFFLVWKILFFCFLGIFAFVFISDIVNFGVNSESFKSSVKFFAYFVIGITVMVGLGYFIYALIMGGKYCVVFEMDEEGINHKQIPEQAKKAKKIAGATAVAGALTGNITTVGVGMNSARTEMYSDFSKVRKVKPYKKRNLIKVNCRLSRNQVYVHDEDFEFVKDYIIQHCGNLKTKTGD